MDWLAKPCLTVLHVIHVAWTCLIALLYYPFVPNPQPLEAVRPKVPTNLALALCSVSKEPSEEEGDALVQSAVSAVRWCKKVGIKSLCVYDRHGELRCGLNNCGEISHSSERLRYQKLEADKGRPQL